MRLLSRDTLELMEVTSSDLGHYQCVVDNHGRPLVEDHKVSLAGKIHKHELHQGY